MRKLIGLLLALNLGVMLAGLALQYWSGQTPPAALFNADKIRQLDLSMPARTPGVAATEPATPPPVESAASAPAEPVAPVAALSRCLQWPSLDVTAFQSIERYLVQSGFAVEEVELDLEKTLGWWVFLPPLENQIEVQARVDEITRLGVMDFALVRGGSMRNAVSLGVFARAAQARQHVANLARKGVKGMQYGPRPEAGQARLQFPASLADNRLEKLLAAWPREVRPMPCLAVVN